MSQLTISKENAINAYHKCCDTSRNVIKALFPDIDFEKPQSIIERVKTWGDACKILGIDPVKSLPYQDIHSLDQDQQAVNAFFMLSKIREVLNEGWKPDWTNSKEPKYVCWFDNYKSGVGFSASGCADWSTYSVVGSRLCFKTSELATYAGKQFINIYNQFLTIK